MAESAQLTTNQLTSDQLAYIEDELRRSSERAAVADLVDHYLRSLDEGAFDASWAEGLFTADIVLAFPVGSHRGRDGVPDFIRTIMGRWARTHHHGSRAVIAVTGAQALLSWSVIASHVHPDSPRTPDSGTCFHLGGRFDAVARLTAGGWRFERIGLQIAWTAGSVPVGVAQTVLDVADTLKDHLAPGHDRPGDPLIERPRKESHGAQR